MSNLDPKTCQCLCNSREEHLEKSLAVAREEIAGLKAKLEMEKEYRSNGYLASVEYARDLWKQKASALAEEMKTIDIETEHPHRQQSSVWEQLIAIGQCAKEALAAYEKAGK